MGSMKELDVLVQRLHERGWDLPVSLKAFDFDRSGDLSKDEFSMAVRAAIHERHENLKALLDGTEDRKTNAHSAMMELMKKVDSDKTGKLSVDELYPLIVGLAAKLNEERPTRDDVLDQLALHDADLNGELDAEEFASLYTDIVCKLYFMPRTTVQLAPEVVK